MPRSSWRKRRAGIDPSDRIYDRRDKRERQVAVAFLVDMSGSTGRQLETGQRRVIDVEKEGLIVLTEALDAIGDQYALYGFSGQGRHQVDFMVLKDFNDTRRYQTGQRIAAMTPLQQNRDGAAIRHTVQKLLRAGPGTGCSFCGDGRPLTGLWRGICPGGYPHGVARGAAAGNQSLLLNH